MTKLLPVQREGQVYLVEILEDGKWGIVYGPIHDKVPFTIYPPPKDAPVESSEDKVTDKAFKPKRLKRRSMKQENKIAKDIGGKRQPGSGAMSHAKGDIRKVGRLRLEAKFTYAKSFRLSVDTLDKIQAEAAPGELPGVVVSLLDKHTNRELQSFVIVPYHDWVREVNNAENNSGSK
jgi:hypothetical protein